MDITVRSEAFGVEDRSWLGSAHGTEATRTITLDVSAFTAGTHYPDGYIPSGTVVARNDSSGMYEPYDGDNTAAGFLFNSSRPKRRDVMPRPGARHDPRGPTP